MKTEKTFKVPFSVYLPATKCCMKTGMPLNAEFVKNIDIDVYSEGGNQWLTEKAHLDIDRAKIELMMDRLIKEHIDNREGQKKLFEAIKLLQTNERIG